VKRKNEESSRVCRENEKVQEEVEVVLKKAQEEIKI